MASADNRLYSSTLPSWNLKRAMPTISPKAPVSHPAMLGSSARLSGRTPIPRIVRADGWAIVRPRGLARLGAFGHGRRLLRLVSIEDALGAVELARHVIGVVVDLPGRAP